MKNLNTMESFRNGFRIVRNGQIITLTRQEMNDFRFFDSAVAGQNSLSYYAIETPEDTEKSLLMKLAATDEQMCYEVWKEYDDTLHEESGTIEKDVVVDYIKANKNRIQNK